MKELTVLEISTIDIMTKWCIDRKTLSPYYSRKVVVNRDTSKQKVFTVQPKLGIVSEMNSDGIQQMLGMNETYKFTTTRLMRDIDGWSRPSARIKYNYVETRVNDPKVVESPDKFRFPSTNKKAAEQ